MNNPQVKKKNLKPRLVTALKFVAEWIVWILLVLMGIAVLCGAMAEILGQVVTAYFPFWRVLLLLLLGFLLAVLLPFWR